MNARRACFLAGGLAALPLLWSLAMYGAPHLPSFKIVRR